MPRKIIQIAAAPDVEIIALCDDGSLWIAHHNRLTGETWEPLPSIPQHSVALGNLRRRTARDGLQAGRKN